MSKMVRLLLFVSLFTLVASASWAQGIFATLTGVVTDPSQSVVAGAKVTLRNIESGTARETTSNGDGYFTFASVPVGTYSVTVEAAGFKTHKEDAIRLGGGDQRNVNIPLAVGGSTETVEVTGVQDFTVAAVDSGEKSFTLETKELQNFTQVGSNAAEYIKITPGFSINSGTGNKASYTGQTIGINANGDSGSQSPLNNNFSYNGLKNNSLDIVADGAHVSDPGCNCDTPVNPNSDFLQEFKVLTSNYSAEEQKGPAVITSVTKSGGSSFHGSGFFSARNAALNSNDWLNQHQGLSKPQNKYYYPGGTIGGPVIIPGTDFNKSRQKLFFFAGFEYFYQVLDTGLLQATVPTDGERAGDFSQAELMKEGGNNHKTASGGPPGGDQLSSPPQSPINPAILDAQGHVLPNLIDANTQALMNLYPHANANPDLTNGYNYVQAEIFNQNNKQFTTRVDYNVSDSTKVFVRYNFQREVQLFPVGLWWRQTDQVPYPSSIQGRNKSDSITGTITHVFSPTMTNEVVMAYTYIGFPNVFANTAAVDRSAIGYGDASLFPNRTTPVSQIPSFGGSGGSGEAALVFNPGGFEAGGKSAGLYADKWMPSVSDTVTKVVKNHTLKAGFFYEWIRNAQPANNNSNGYMQFLSSNPKSYGNVYADMITGNMASYNETNFNRLNDISYNTIEFFGQDSWKATRKLTVEFGLRLTRFTPWTDDEGFGYSIFNPAAYDPTCAASPTFCGFQWHAQNSSVPLTGFPTRALYYQPRLGAAYDIFGRGNTVLRGGWGRFYYHSGQFTNGLDLAAGSAAASLNPTNWDTTGSTCSDPSSAPLLARNLSCINANASPASPFAVDSKDNKQPYTDSWSFTVSQRTPWQSRLEVAYVGNRSRDQLNIGGAGSNLNLVPLGAITSDPTVTNASLAKADKYRPLNTCCDSSGNPLGYGDVNTAVNNIYSNYNGLQVTWGRHAGRYTLQANYSYQKALGIVQPGNPANNPSVTLNPFNLDANYGVMPGDRRQVFNVAYSVDLGRPFHGEKFLGGAINGWQISGITQLQSGANLTYLSSNDNFNMSLNNAIIPGSVSLANPNGVTITNQSILGTNAMQLNPIVTCNPKSGLASHQYVNGNCFAVPTAVGQSGPALLPVVYGPGYFNSDLALFKNFSITESKKLQFRVNAYNFMNHPLWSFNGADNLHLNYQQDPTTQAITLTNSNFGKTTTKEGNRVVEFAVKFYF
jgi:hypothetical protein